MIIAVAINPRASFGGAQHTGAVVVDFFRAAGASVIVLRRDSYDRLAEAVGEALAAGCDALVVVGGDGMVHLGINALAGPGAPYGSVPLGIVPSGTGNDMARALGLPLKDAHAACERIWVALKAGGRLIDAGRHYG